MSNKTHLQTNNTALDGYIARINAAKEVAASLPDAGGGSGENVEVCNFTFSCDEFMWTHITAVVTTAYENGEFIEKAYFPAVDSSTSKIMTNIVKGAPISVFYEQYSLLGVQSTGVIVQNFYNRGVFYCTTYKIKNDATEATLYFYDDD